MAKLYYQELEPEAIQDWLGAQIFLFFFFFFPLEVIVAEVSEVQDPERDFLFFESVSAYI